MRYERTPGKYDSNAGDTNMLSTYLYEPGIVPSHHQFPIPSNVPAPRDILETRNSLCDPLCSWRIYLYACSGGHGIAVGLGGGEMDGGNGSVFLDEDGVLVLPPIPGLRVMFGGSGTHLSADDDGLVVHDAGHGAERLCSSTWSLALAERGPVRVASQKVRKRAKATRVS